MTCIIHKAHLLAIAFMHALHQIVDCCFKPCKLRIANAQLCIGRCGIDVVNRILQITELAFVKLLRGSPFRCLSNVINRL